MVAREPRWLLRCLYAVAKVPGVVDLVLLGYPGLLLWCFYAVAKMPGVVARVPGVVAKVMLCSCYVNRVVAKVFLCCL